MNQTHVSLCLCALLVTAVVPLVGCETPSVQALGPDAFRKGHLSFIQDGRTTREQVLLKLGVPSAQIEEQEI